MDNCLDSLNNKGSLEFRTGIHTNGISPAWNKWQKSPFTFVQRDSKGNICIAVIGGFEIALENLGLHENGVYSFDVGDHIVEIKE